MRINLFDIPEEGKTFFYDQKSAELNGILRELIENQNYKVEVTIRPINHRDFELTGKIETSRPDMCSRCGIDFKIQVNPSFHEILIPEAKDNEKGHYAKTNHLSDESNESMNVCSYTGNGHFNLGDYIHEQIAINIPFNPAPEETPEGDCSLCKIDLKKTVFSHVEEFPEEPKISPFQALKNLKIQ